MKLVNIATEVITFIKTIVVVVGNAMYQFVIQVWDRYIGGGMATLTKDQLWGTMCGPAVHGCVNCKHEGYNGMGCGHPSQLKSAVLKICYVTVQTTDFHGKYWEWDGKSK